jgi:signal transduction histidine kinase
MVSEPLTLFGEQEQRLFDDLKKRFVTTVSHELKTSLTVVGGYLDLLQAHAQQMDREQIITLLSQAHEGYQDLLSLVNTMTEAATLTEQFSIEEVEQLSLKEIFQKVLEKFDPLQAQTYNIEYCIDDTLQVWADRQALEQVIRHLLSNVFKYVPCQTTVTIAARYLEAASSICVSLQDAGPGIPPEEIPWLFERFTRLRRDVAGPIPGMGLGLFISKCLIEAMGGHIWVQSSGQAGGGSCFCFTLPSQPQLPSQLASEQ